MFPRGFWTKLVEKALTTPYLALLMVMSVLLSVASFYTTFDGLSDFLPFALLSIFVTLAIQSLLFVTSWRLGFMLADKEPVAWLDVGVFAVCFALSVLFSFTSLFNVVFSPEQQELARITRVHNGVIEAIASAGDKTRERRRDLVQDLIRSQEYAAWSRNVGAVADLAGDSQVILAKVFADSHERRHLRAEQLAREAQEVAASDKTLARVLNEDEAALERAVGRRGPLEEGLLKLRSDLGAAEDAVVVKQHEMDAEERGVGATGRPSRGPVWSGLAKEQQRLIAARDALANRIALEERRLQDLDAERITIQGRIDQTREQQVGLGARIAAAASAAEEARRDLAAAGANATTLDLDQSVEALRANLPKFATTLSLVPFDDAAALCQRLLTDMSAIPVLEQKAKGLSCDRGSMLTLLSPINDAAALTVVERDCLSGGAGAKTVDDLSFDEALSYGRSCLEAASLPSADTRSERRELDRLTREESPQASPFTKTTNALFAGEKLAVFALLIALAIDLLVLFVGLIGARAVETGVEAPVAPVLPTDSPQMRLYKLVLAATHAANLKLDGTRYDHRVVLAGISDEGDRERVRQFLVSNTAKGSVRPIEQKEGEFLLRHGVADRLRNWLEDEAERTAPPPPPPPSAPRRSEPTQPPRQAAPQPQARPQVKPTGAPRTIDDLDPEFVPVGRLDLISEPGRNRQDAAAPQWLPEPATDAADSRRDARPAVEPPDKGLASIETFFR